MEDDKKIIYFDACCIQVDFVMEILSKLVSKQVCLFVSSVILK